MGSTIAVALALLALFVALGGGAWAVVSKEKGVERAATLTFSADGVEHELFKIGGSTLITRCTVVNDPGSPEDGGISREIGVAAGPQGAVVVQESSGEQFFEEIGPNGQEPILLDASPPAGSIPR